MGDINTSQELLCIGARGLLTREMLPNPKTMLITHIIFSNFISITATFGNLLILVAIWRRPSLRSPSITLLFSLALSDLFVGLIVVPLNSGVLVELFKNQNYVISCTLLKLCGISFLISTEVTLLTVTAISVDRYLAIYIHLRYEQVVTGKRTKMLISCLWIASGLHSTVWVCYGYLDVPLIIFASIITTCLITVTFTWIKIYQVVRHHQAQIQDQFHHVQGQQFNMAIFKKSAINNGIVLVFFLVCYFPCLISAILLAYEATPSFKTTAAFTFLLVFLNSSLNRLVYCWGNRNIRASAKATLMKLFCQVVEQ